MLFRFYLFYLITRSSDKQQNQFTLIFFVELDFEIVVHQKTRARDRTFEGVPDSGYPPVPAGQRPYLVNFGSIFPNHLIMIKTMLWGALLVATSLLNTFIKLFFTFFISKLDKNWLSYEQNTIFGHTQQHW